MRGHWFGDRAVLIPLVDPTSRHAVVATLREALPGCAVRAGMDTVLVEAPAPDPGLLAAVDAVQPLADHDDVHGSGREVVLPVHYDGVDLAEAAAMLGLAPAGLAAAHQAQVWQVAMLGFAPGFGYLVPVGAASVDWTAIDRRSTPRTEVPAGSVAVAAGMSAVYPHALPGGWQLIGTTTATMFDADDPDRPSTLRPGDTVRFADPR